jgi:hypothetical protein
MDELPHPVALGQMPHSPPKGLPVGHTRVEDMRSVLDHLGSDVPAWPSAICPAFIRPMRSG